MRIAAAVVLLAVVGLAQADGGSIPESGIEPGPIEQIRVEGGRTIPYQRLFEVVGEPGETMDQFAMRVAPRLRAFTEAERFEACGVIATDGQRFGVVIGTNRGRTACALMDRFPNGMGSMAQAIHSHPQPGVYHATPFDRLILGEKIGKRSVVRVDLYGVRVFSDRDFKQPGYLVERGNLWHHKGKDTVRLVGAIAEVP